MMNRWLGGMFAASLLLVVACEGGGGGADTQPDEDALTGDFETAESRVAGDGGVAAAGGRGGCRGVGRGRGGRGPDGRAHAHDGGAARDDRDDDQDEAQDDRRQAGPDDDHRQAGRGGAHDGGMHGRRDDERCSGGRDRDGGPGHARDGGAPIGPGGGGRGPQRDAGTPPGSGAASTVTLPDGTTVRLDPSCPSLDRGGFSLPGCCLPANACGLSTHLIDVTGVPKGCQGYDQARQIDPSFPLPDKACSFRN